MSELLVSYY